MKNYARTLCLSLLFLLSTVVMAAVEKDAQGEWLVKDKTAHIRIVSCDRKLWGVISWVMVPDTDKNNPDVSLRDRPVLGIPILRGMHTAKEGWDGDIYNADNGKIYRGNISMKSPDVLHVKGCVLGGLICGGEDWTRLEAAPDQETPERICKRIK